MISVTAGDPPTLRCSGEIDFSRLGFAVPGVPNMAAAVCHARLSFPEGGLPYLTNVSATLQIPIPNQTNFVDVTDGVFTLEGLPSGRVSLRKDLTLIDAGGFQFVLLGAGHSNCPPSGLTVYPSQGLELPSFKLDGGGLTVRGTFVSSSDRNAKENYEAVNPREVLEKVAALPLTRWNFKADPGTPHLGPVAQDFYAAFGVGADDKHIATVDADGVALAAIQGLNQKLEEKLAAQDAALKAKDAELQDLRQSVEELKALVRQSASPAAGAHPTD